MIAIVDYGMGNLTSIANMLHYIGATATITGDPKLIKDASKIILPGVGHFKRGMENLHESGLTDILNETVSLDKKPTLGICLGAQLMTMHSEEGDVDGLKWINANTVAFNKERMNGLKVPHMGWAEVDFIDKSPLWEGLPGESRFYHVHSYHFEVNEEQFVSATAVYGYEFVCAFRKDNIFGVQFHPEKSHKYGMNLLKNFSTL
jgi:glutamine amidotransferase